MHSVLMFTVMKNFGPSFHYADTGMNSILVEFPEQARKLPRDKHALFKAVRR